MAEVLYTNNATATLAAPVAPSDVSITVSNGAPFPSPTGGNFFYLTIDSGASIEIVKVTARSLDVLTVERAQQGTIAGTFPVDTPVALRVTAGGFEHIYDEINLKFDAAGISAFGEVLIAQTTDTAARATLGLGNLATVAASAFALTILDDADASAVRTTIGAAATSHTHAAADITSGTIATARLGSGTANSTTFLRGDQTWAAAGVGDMLKSENLSGLANYTTARSNLGLAIGTNVQAYDAGLQSIAGLTTAADRMIYTTASDVYAVATLTSFARTILDDADAATARGTLGLGTAAVLNTGTSGATIPRNDTANTWSALQTFSGTANTSEVIRVSNTADGRRVHVYPIRVGSQNGDLNVDAMDGHNVNIQTSSTTRATVSSSGATFFVPMEIQSTGLSLYINGATDPYIQITDTTNPTTLFMQAVNAQVNIGSTTNHPLALYTNSVQRGQVTTAGRLEWGTAGVECQGLLQVTGTSFAQVFTTSPILDLIRSSGATNPTVQLRTGARYDRIMNTSSGLWFGVDYSGTEKNLLYSSTGDFSFGADPPGPASERTIGFRGAPRNRQDSSYTLVLSDAGKSIVGYGSTASQTWTIPANASVAYPIGTTIVFCNMRSVACSIAVTTDTLYQAGTGATGTRTLAAYSMATAIKVDTNNWLISGAGLS